MVTSKYIHYSLYRRSTSHTCLLQITPNRDLIWSPCFTDFQCARLDVPLDWLDPSDDSRVILAIIKLPAADLTDYKGPVFTNPGGPGGSGVYALKNRGRLLQKVVGTNHDIISFDPRGIGATTPLVDCWSSKLRRDVWSMQDVGVIDSHPGVLYDAYARSIALSRLCIAAIGQNETGKENEILSFVSTASVARDMLEIMNKGGREKLRYWGFSYGTVLGGTFAAMYPNKIDRMVNDGKSIPKCIDSYLQCLGNVDYSEWSTNIHRNFLHDSDKIMAAFYHLCHKAGVSACAFYSSSPSLIKERLQTVLENLKKHPIIVSPLDEITGLPEIITYSSLQRLISASLYRPILLFPFLAQVLASLEAGDGLPFLDVASTFGMHSEFSCNCEASGVTPILEVEGNDDASIAIQCADGGEMIETAEEFEEYANYLMGQGKSAGAVNALFRMACAGWTSTAKWRFTGTTCIDQYHSVSTNVRSQELSLETQVIQSFSLQIKQTMSLHFAVQFRTQQVFPIRLS